MAIVWEWLIRRSGPPAHLTCLLSLHQHGRSSRAAAGCGGCSFLQARHAVRVAVVVGGK